MSIVVKNRSNEEAFNSQTAYVAPFKGEEEVNQGYIEGSRRAWSALAEVFQAMEIKGVAQTFTCSFVKYKLAAAGISCSKISEAWPGKDSELRSVSLRLCSSVQTAKVQRRQ